MKKIIKILLIYLIPIFIYTFFNFPFPKVLGIVTSTLILWITELIPLSYTAVLIPLVSTLFEITKFKESLDQFSHPILFLFIGCFFLTAAFKKSHLDKRVSLFLLKIPLFSKNTTNLLISVTLLSWFLSMWISNTAACAILIPILTSFYSSDESKALAIDLKLYKKLLISSAYGSSIGGLCTPVGSPPNLLALDVLERSGMNISFFKWLMIGMPISLVMLGALLLILGFIFKTERKELDNSFFKEKYDDLGKFTKKEKITIFAFIMTVILWIIPKSITGLSISESVLIGTFILFAFNLDDGPILSLPDFKGIDWGVIFLFAGGLTLGSIMEASGLANYVSTKYFQDITSLVTLGILVTFTAIILSELGSNTASAALILPLVGAIDFSTFGQGSLLFLVLCASFGASFGFMLPVSTPPNALIFSTGKLKVSDLMKSGISFDIAGLVVIVVGLFLLLL